MRQMGRAAIYAESLYRRQPYKGAQLASIIGRNFTATQSPALGTDVTEFKPSSSGKASPAPITLRARLSPTFDVPILPSSKRCSGYSWMPNWSAEPILRIAVAKTALRPISGMLAENGFYPEYHVKATALIMAPPSKFSDTLRTSFSRAKTGTFESFADSTPISRIGTR